MVESLESRLRRIQDEFTLGLPDRVTEILGVWDSDLPAAGLLKRAHHLTHRLAGGAGTLGQQELSTACRVLDLDLQALIEAGNVLDEHTRFRLRQRTADLLTTIRNLP